MLSGSFLGESTSGPSAEGENPSWRVNVDPDALRQFGESEDVGELQDLYGELQGLFQVDSEDCE